MCLYLLLHLLLCQHRSLLHHELAEERLAQTRIHLLLAQRVLDRHHLLLVVLNIVLVLALLHLQSIDQFLLLGNHLMRRLLTRHLLHLHLLVLLHNHMVRLLQFLLHHVYLLL